MADFYRAEKVNDRITAIISFTGEIMYLVNGSERSLLIDTCVGAGNLRDFVERLTEKPLTVLLTHGHIDHAMGAPEFTGNDGKPECEIYMNHADTEIYLGMNSIENRKGYVLAGLGGQMPEGLEETFLPPAPMTFKDLKMVTDLTWEDFRGNLCPPGAHSGNHGHADPGRKDPDPWRCLQQCYLPF